MALLTGLCNGLGCKIVSTYRRLHTRTGFEPPFVSKNGEFAGKTVIWLSERYKVLGSVRRVVLSILGKNDVGKTTFIRCLTAEVKNYSGSIKIDDQEVRDLSIGELSKAIAVVASNNPCYQNLSVADFLVTGFANKLAALHAPNRQQYENT